MASTTYPATQKQIGFMQSLLRQRQMDPRWEAQLTVDIRAALEHENMTADRASKWISWLLEQPKKPKKEPNRVTLPPPAPTAPAVDPAAAPQTLYPGVYKYSQNLYRVIGTGPNQRVRLVSLYRGKPKLLRVGYETSNRVREQGIRLTAEEAASYGADGGAAKGWCICCGRELSDPASVAAGIGPVCAAAQARTA